MAAVFAAAAEAPITAIVIVFEMSYDYTIVLPLMIATVIATILGRRLINGTVYELKLLRRGIDWQRVRRPRALANVPVSTVEREASVVARDGELARCVLDRLGATGDDAVPVVDARGDLIGIVTSVELARSVIADPSAHVDSVMRPVPLTLCAHDSLERAADVLSDPTVGLVPIVTDGTSQLRAIVTRRDVLDAYRSLAKN
jgi:CIC family chloride channel protein